MSNLKELISILDINSKIFIQTHNFPDPDCIAAAMGLKYLLYKNGIISEICHSGEVSRHSTKKLIEKLNIEMKDIRYITDMTENSNIILIDTQKANSNTKDLIGNEVACIDHHEENRKEIRAEYKFKDIRPNVGACSSIIARYFLEEDIEIPQDIATALTYGIKADTLDFTRGVSKFDIEIYGYLHGLVDARILEELQKDKLELNDLYAFSKAFNSLKIIDDIGFINVGINCPDPLLASISDFILSVVEINFAILYCNKEIGVKFSIRNNIENFHAGKIIAEVLEGVGNGGGHKEMAGGLIPKKNLKLIEKDIDKFVESKFIEVIKFFEEEELLNI